MSQSRAHSCVTELHSSHVVACRVAVGRL